MTGQRLKELREARGMLQREYAEALGVHRQTIIRSENTDGTISKTLREKVVSFELEQTQIEAEANREKGTELQNKMIALAKGDI